MKAATGTYVEIIKALPTADQVTQEMRWNALRTREVVVDGKPIDNVIYADDEAGVIILALRPKRVTLIPRADVEPWRTALLKT